MEPSPIINKHNGLKKGITLMEIMVAAVIATTLLLAITQVDLTRTILGNWARSASKIEAPLALAHIIRQLQNADRVIIRNFSTAGDIQFRFWNCAAPATAACYGNPANARWAEYKRDSTNNQLRFYPNASSCGTVGFRFFDITAFSVSFQDPTPSAPPPGGEPVTQDNNMVQISVTSVDPNDTSKIYTYAGEVAFRAGAYTDVGSTAIDSGCGLAQCGLADPPNAGC
jgi:hypothetical protein